MVTKLEYLKRCITDISAIEDKSWYINTIAIPLISKKIDIDSNTKPLSIVCKLDGLYFVDVNESNTLFLNKISDYKKDIPLFTFQDVIEVDSTWLPSIKQKITTKLGNLIINALVLYPSLKNKIEYINTPIDIKIIEELLSTRVKNIEDAKPTDITVKEMIECIDRLCFLTNLADIINIASTPKVITPPPDLDVKKKDILKKYNGQLSDPVKLIEMTNELIAIDKEYLADDNSANKIFTKKQRNARKKLYLTYGDALMFNKSTQSNNVIPSLNEGLSTESDDFIKYMNDLRVGSYARGTYTQLGGYTYKILQRSLSTLAISGTPCSTSVGLKRVVFKSTASKLINRYIKQDKKWILISTLEEANKYINTTVEVRSAMYCRAEGNTVCYSCLSEVYKSTPTGITNIAAEMSSAILTQFLKLMHGSETETTTINMDDLVT